MKRNFHFTLVLLSLIFVGFTQNSSAQGSLKYDLTVFGEDQRPLPNLSIVLVETSTFVRKEYKTNSAGKLSLNLTEGKEWVMNIGDMKNHNLLRIPPGDGTGSQIVTYDVERWNRINEPPVDRSKIKLNVVQQKIAATEQPTPSEAILQIMVGKELGGGWPNIPVQLTCYKLNTTFATTTDGSGTARFKVPINNNYQIDLDGEENFDYCDIGTQSYKRTVNITYNKINFKETVNDKGFIEQTFIQAPEPVSNRVMVTLFVRGGENGGANEDVYLDMAYSNKKYHGKTDETGKVIFMLPKKTSYKVSFNYQKDAGVVDLSRFFGIGQMSNGFYYEPDPRLQYPERYLPSKTDVKSFDINNYVTEKYPNTDDNNLLNVHARWGNNKINSGSKESLLELGFSVKMPKAKRPVSKPLNIAFVLDKSGSMHGERIDYLKAAMMDFIDKLRPTDRISIVFFDSEAVVAYDQPSVNNAVMKDIIGALLADGGTNIFEGLKLGYQQVSKNKSEGSIDRVILLTDGYGSTPVDEIMEQSATFFDKGIGVSTIGVGEYNHSLLTLLSQYSGGMEHQALQSEGITTAINNEFESLMYPLATDLKVKVKYNNRVIYKTLYGIPEAKEDGNSVQFKMDNVYSSLNKMVLMKFKLENPALDIKEHKITVQVDYFDVGENRAVEIVKDVNLEWTDETDTELIVNNQLKHVYSIAVANQVFKLLVDLCEGQKYSEAKAKINETLKSLKEINQDKYSEDLIPVIEQLKEYLKALDLAIKKFK